jgi:hypothetical protein
MALAGKKHSMGGRPRQLCLGDKRVEVEINLVKLPLAGGTGNEKMLPVSNVCVRRCPLLCQWTICKFWRVVLIKLLLTHLKKPSLDVRFKLTITVPEPASTAGLFYGRAGVSCSPGDSIENIQNVDVV